MDILFKNNKLVSQTYSKELTVSQIKVYNSILLSTQKKSNETTMCCSIKREDLYKLINDKNIKTIKKALEFLNGFSEYTIDLMYGVEIMKTRLVHTVTYNPNTDTFSIRLEKELYETIFNYKEDGYTPLNVPKLNNSKSLYTIFLYEELRKWSRYNTKVVRRYNLDKLKEIMQCINTYNTYYEFKRKVLNKAINEINEKMNMEVSFEEFKRLRKVAEIEFTIVDHEQRQYDFNEHDFINPVKFEVSEDNISSEDYVQLIDLGIRESVHQKFINDFADYKEYLKAVEKAVEKTLDSIGGKTINTRNYKYFKAVLNNLMPTD